MSPHHRQKGDPRPQGGQGTQASPVVIADTLERLPQRRFGVGSQESYNWSTPRSSRRAANRLWLLRVLLGGSCPYLFPPEDGSFAVGGTLYVVDY